LRNYYYYYFCHLALARPGRGWGALPGSKDPGKC